MKRSVRSPIAAALLGAALLAAPALGSAQEQDRGWYAGGSLGRADYKNTCEGLGVPCDDSDSAWRLFGGYRYSRGVAVEVGYADFGATSASGTVAGVGVQAHAEVTAWDLSGVFSLPVGERLSIFGKLGVYRAEVESAGNVGAFTGSASDTGSGFTYGVGAQYDLSRAFGVRAEWQAYDNVGGPGTGEDDVSALMLGVLLRF